MEDNGILVEYAYSFLRLIFNTAQLGFYHCTLQLYHCKNVQYYPPILGPGPSFPSLFTSHRTHVKSYLPVKQQWLELVETRDSFLAGGGRERVKYPSEPCSFDSVDGSLMMMMEAEDGSPCRDGSLMQKPTTTLSHHPYILCHFANYAHHKTLYMHLAYSYGLNEQEVQAVWAAEEGNLEDALEVLMRAVNEAPNYTSPYNNRTQVYCTMLPCYHGDLGDQAH